MPSSGKKLLVGGKRVRKSIGGGKRREMADTVTEWQLVVIFERNCNFPLLTLLTVTIIKLILLRFIEKVVEHDFCRWVRAFIPVVATGSFLPKKVLLKISSILQENTWGLQLYLKETPKQVFSSEIWEIFKNTFFEEHLSTTAFVIPWMILIYL